MKNQMLLRTTLNFIRSKGHFAVGLLGAVLLVGHASPVQAISCGDTLNGGSHTLGADLDCSAGGTAVMLDQAVLDMNGFTITCGAGEQCIGLKYDSEVHGGTVNGGGVGVNIRFSGNYVHDMTVLNADIGIATRQNTGDHSTISNNYISRCGHGIVSSFNGARPDLGSFVITDNVVTHSATWGIWVYSRYNLISGNTANHNGSHGFRIGQLSNTVEGNTANHNTGSGIYLLNFSDDVSVVDNTTNANMVDGIHVSEGADVDLLGNVAFHNGDNGINNIPTGSCPTTGPDKNKAKHNETANFVGCP